MVAAHFFKCVFALAYQVVTFVRSQVTYGKCPVRLLLEMTATNLTAKDCFATAIYFLITTTVLM